MFITLVSEELLAAAVDHCDTPTAAIAITTNWASIERYAIFSWKSFKLARLSVGQTVGNPSFRVLRCQRAAFEPEPEPREKKW